MGLASSSCVGLKEQTLPEFTSNEKLQKKKSHVRKICNVMKMYVRTLGLVPFDAILISETA